MDARDNNLKVRTSADLFPNSLTFNNFPVTLGGTGTLLNNKGVASKATGISTTYPILSEPYALVIAGPAGIRAVWQTRGSNSNILIADVPKFPPKKIVPIEFQHSPTTGDVFLPGNGQCDRLVGAYASESDGKFEYRLWTVPQILDNASPLAQIAPGGSTVPLDPKAGDAEMLTLDLLVLSVLGTTRMSVAQGLSAGRYGLIFGTTFQRFTED